MKSLNIFVVVPTIRSLDVFSEWKNLLSDCHLIIIEDRPAPQIRPPQITVKSLAHYSWSDIKADFGQDEWIFSRRNAGIRNYGFYKAYQAGADVIITLDDDCYPIDRDWVGQHIGNLEFRTPASWQTTYPHPHYLYTRGFPYSVRGKHSTVISHGLWSGALDQDAKTEVITGKLNEPSYPLLRSIIPSGYFFPMSSMNLAFCKEITPAMFFPMMGYDPLGKPWGFDRYDDIWAGIFVKKVCDHLELAVVSGSPFVEHRKASDPAANLEKEKAGLAANEYLWQRVAAVKLTKSSPVACYQELARKTEFPQIKYFQKLRRAMLIWSGLFQK